MNKKTHPLRMGMMWFLGMVCIALIAGMAYVFMLLVMDLVESSNIKTEMSNMLIPLNANQQGIILAAMS